MGADVRFMLLHDEGKEAAVKSFFDDVYELYIKVSVVLVCDLRPMCDLSCSLMFLRLFFVCFFVFLCLVSPITAEAMPLSFIIPAPVPLLST